MTTVFSGNYPVDRSVDEMVVHFEALTFTGEQPDKRACGPWGRPPPLEFGASAAGRGQGAHPHEWTWMPKMGGRGTDAEPPFRRLGCSGVVDDHAGVVRDRAAPACPGTPSAPRALLLPKRPCP